jgi:hypothetical protein
MLSLAVETARGMSGRWAARRVSRKGLLERPRFRPAPTDFAPPIAPLTVVLLDLVRAVCGAVRTKLHCSDCRECAYGVANNPQNPAIIASTLTIALPLLIWDLCAPTN